MGIVAPVLSFNSLVPGATEGYLLEDMVEKVDTLVAVLKDKTDDLLLVVLNKGEQVLIIMVGRQKPPNPPLSLNLHFRKKKIQNQQK